MRVYFEKPRTTVGWKGLINDPYLDESFRIDEGLRIARQLLIEINRLGLPAGSEFLDVISPQYIGDLISWGAIGARTTESQVHRELASGLSAPIGFKNGTDGNIRIATDAIQAAARGHHFLSVHKNGQVAIVQTNGNKDCHVILRGGKAPNYDAASVGGGLQGARSRQAAADADGRLQPCQQQQAARASRSTWRGTSRARSPSGSRSVFGVMVESHLNSGAQKFSAGKDDPAALEYGKSITDACLGWGDSLQVLEMLSEAVKVRRGRYRLPSPKLGMAENSAGSNIQRTESCRAASVAVERKYVVTASTHAGKPTIGAAHPVAGNVGLCPGAAAAYWKRP